MHLVRRAVKPQIIGSGAQAADSGAICPFRSTEDMNKLVLALGAIVAVGAVQANAQTVVSDTDGNGSYSIEELQAAFPDMTDAVFSTVDVDGDGAVDADELKAAQEAGTLPS